MSNPFDYFDPTGEKQKDFMDEFVRAAKKAAGASASIPEAKACSTARELADWFMSFSLACRANRPKGEPNA